MITDTGKKEFIKECLEEFLYKNSMNMTSGFFFSIPNGYMFPVNEKNIRKLTDFLFSEMENQKSFFEYNCEGLLDNKNKIVKIPYNTSKDIYTLLVSLKRYLYDNIAYQPENSGLYKLKECLEEQYSEILCIEALEQEQKLKEEQEKKEYSEYLRLKKKYEG